MKLKNYRKQKRQGFTLVELMVTVLVTGIFAVGMMQVFMAMSRMFSAQDAKRQGQQNLRIVLDYVTDDFRSTQYQGGIVQFNGEQLDLGQGLILEDGVGPDSTDFVHIINNLKIMRPDDEPVILRSRRVRPRTINPETGETITKTEPYPTPEYPDCPEDPIEDNCPPGGYYDICDGSSSYFDDAMETHSDPIIVEDTGPLQDYMQREQMQFPILARIYGAYRIEGTQQLVGETEWYTDGYYTTTEEIFAITSLGSRDIRHEAYPPWNPTNELLRLWGFYGYPPNGDCNANGSTDGKIPTWGITSDIKIEPVKYTGWKVVYFESVARNRLVRTNNIDPNILGDVVADYVVDFQVRDNPSIGGSTSFYTVVVIMQIPSRNQPGEFITVADSTMLFR